VGPIALVAATGILLTACGAAGAPASTLAAETSRPSPRFTPIPTEAPSPTPKPSASASPSPTPEPDYSLAPMVAEEPVALAQQLAMAETAIRDPNVTGAKLTYMGHLEQLAISSINDNPKWKDQVLAALPENVRNTVAGSIEAGRVLRQLHGPTPKTLPDWKIVDPAPATDLMKFYKEGEQKFGVPWYYLAAINLVETRMGRIRGISSAGALGPMQFIQSTWDAYGAGGDVNDPHDAIIGAARYLKAAGAPGDMQKALFAYNHSQAYVDSIAGYALVMKADPEAFRGYHGWQVYYTTVDGTSWLKVGWKKPD
jgi:soluble lytic murein transglycosylase-like protein